MNPLYPRVLYAKFDWNRLCGSGEDFKILSMYFWYFVIISHWLKVWPFRWTNLNPLLPRMLCAKYDCNWHSGSAEEDFLILSMYLSYFIIIFPCKWVWSFIPFSQGIFVPSLVEIGSVVLEKRMKMWKVNRQTNGQTVGQTDKLTELKA